METHRLARALDELLAATARREHADADAAHCGPADESLVPLLALARALAALPAPPAPTPAFRARLAAELAAAPPPAHLAAALPTTGALVRMLDDALARLRAGDDPATVVADLPAGAEELAGLVPLAAALDELPSAGGPSAAFRSALAARLAAAPRPSSLAARPHASGLAAAWLGAVWRSTAFSAAAAATVLLMAGAGLGLAARDSAPGSPLHPVRVTLERLDPWLRPGAPGAATALVDAPAAPRPVARRGDPAAALAARAADAHPWRDRVALAPLGRSPVAARPVPPPVVASAAGAVPVAARPAAPALAAVPTAAPPQAPARAHEGPRPSPWPTVAPTAAPPDPTPPVAPSPIATEPAPTAVPTEPPGPSPTPEPGPSIPTVLEITCTPDPVKSAGSAECRVTNLAAGAGAVEWTASMGRIERLEADGVRARFVDDVGVSGVSRMFVTVTATLRPDPAWSGPEPAVGQVVIVVEPEIGIQP